MQENFIIKDRVSKSYRHPELDKKIIKQRTKKEASILEKSAKLGISPKPFFIPLFNKIKMPYIKGEKLSESLEKLNYKEICKQIGENIAKLHDNNIIHGDLTTSNMIYVKEKDKNTNPAIKNLEITNKVGREAEHAQASSNKRAEGEPKSKVVFIDFGLGFISPRIEDKAVDLHLIKQALEAKHFSIHKECEKIILENYNSKDKAKVIEQLKKVEARGRYKQGS